MYIDPTARREVARYFAFVVCVLAVFFASPSSAQIVALGASNVKGYGVSASDSFPAQLEAMLRAKRKPYSVANAGISGDTSAAGHKNRDNRDQRIQRCEARGHSRTGARKRASN
jgi:lysophospholipase L1-like esterase